MDKQESNSENKFPEKLAKQTLKKIIDFLKSKKILQNQEILVEIATVSRERIHELNKKYRNKDQATDILSFAYQFDDEIFEGDLILCWEIIQGNAKEDKIKPEQELIKNLVHGCLHLAGREHSTEMFQLQEQFCRMFY